MKGGFTRHVGATRSRPERIADGIWVLRAPLEGTYVAIYVVRGRRIGVIDTGWAPHPRDVILPAAASIGIDIEEIDFILNTHGHDDHIGGNGDLKQMSHAAIHVHRADAPLADGPDAHVRSEVDAISAMRTYGWADEVSRREAVLMRRVGEGVRVDRVLEDGDEVDLGLGRLLRVVHTPGHTPGSVTYVLDQEGMAFTGDAVQGRGAVAGTLPFYTDSVAYVESLKRIRSLEVNTLCMSHPFVVDAVAAPSHLVTSEAIAGALGFSAEIVEALNLAASGSTQSSSAEEAVRSMIQRLPEDLRVPVDDNGRFDADATFALLAHLVEQTAKGRYPTSRPLP